MAASQSQYRIVISLRDGGGILVERQLEIVHQWKTVDRYNTHDLTKELKRSDPWIAEVLALCSQPSAAIEIAIPKVPPLEPSVWDRLTEYDKQAREMEMQAQHDAEFRVAQQMPTIVERERPLAATLLEGNSHLADSLEG